VWRAGRVGSEARDGTTNSIDSRPGDIDGDPCGDEQRRARQQRAALQSALGDSGLRCEIGGTTPSCAGNATRRARRRGRCSEARSAMVGDAQRSTATWPWSGVVRVAQRCAPSGSARHREARSATFATQRRTVRRPCAGDTVKAAQRYASSGSERHRCALEVRSHTLGSVVRAEQQDAPFGNVRHREVRSATAHAQIQWAT